MPCPMVPAPTMPTFSICIPSSSVGSDEDTGIRHESGVTFNHHSHGPATTQAQCRQPAPHSPRPHGIEERGQDPGTTRPDGVAERDRPTVDVDQLPIPPELLA